MISEKSIVHEGWMMLQGGSHNNNNNNNTNEIDNIQTNNQGTSEDTTKKDLDSGILQISPALLPLSIESNKNNLIRQGRWWEKWITVQNHSHQQPQERERNPAKIDSRIDDLEEPKESEQTKTESQSTMPTIAAGRRLEGDPAIKVQIPLANTLGTSFRGGVVNNKGIGGSSKVDSGGRSTLDLTKQQSIARLAVTREWELRTAHGLGRSHHHSLSPQEKRNPPLLDGRMYMSSKESYPIMVFSLLRYEPKREETLRLRKKLEARGGGGTQFFIMPLRDWRGISFRSLLPEAKKSQQHGRDHVERNGNQRNERNAVDRTTSTCPKKYNNNKLIFDRFALKRIMSKDDLTVDNVTKVNKVIQDDDADDVDDDVNSDSDAEEGWSGQDPYVAGLLDDPEMVQGRWRNVMIGDRGTGPIVSSTIQFVKPKILKADLNKQFRERFDHYEPPVPRRKYIGAKVINGVYTLLDPTQTNDTESNIKNGECEGGYNDGNTDDNDTTGGNTTTTGSTSKTRTHRRRVSTSSVSLSKSEGGEGEGKESIRMPPSLTLSKIRSLKEQALAAAVEAKLEISTMALAIIYFERLCLDCRVDKQNRRLSFAACLLLAIKINEVRTYLSCVSFILLGFLSFTNISSYYSYEKPNVGVIITQAIKKSKTSQRIQSLIRPNKKSGSMFASLLEFFTQRWNISLPNLYAAEWGVFAALQFRLKAKPSDVAFHFKLIMKSLDKDPVRYLGVSMYGCWQQALNEEELHRQELKSRVEEFRQRKEKKKLKQLQRELEAANLREKSDKTQIDNGLMRYKHTENPNGDIRVTLSDHLYEEITVRTQGTVTRRRRGLGDILKNRIGGGIVAKKKTRSRSSDCIRTRDTSSKDLSTTVHLTAVGTDKRRVSFGGNTANVDNSVVVARQRHRPPLSLRPLSSAKSMLSMTNLEKNNSPPSSGRAISMGNTLVDKGDDKCEGIMI